MLVDMGICEATGGGMCPTGGMLGYVCPVPGCDRGGGCDPSGGWAISGGGCDISGGCDDIGGKPPMVGGRRGGAPPMPVVGGRVGMVGMVPRDTGCKMEPPPAVPAPFFSGTGDIGVTYSTSIAEER